MNLFYLFVIAQLLLTSCSKKLVLKYQMDSLNTEILVLKPSNPTRKTNITVNDNLVVNKKNVKSVTIYNIPEGDNNINFTCDNSFYNDKINGQFTVKIDSGQVITKLIQIPPFSTGFWIYVTTPVILGSLIYVLDKK